MEEKFAQREGSEESSENEDDLLEPLQRSRLFVVSCSIVVGIVALTLVFGTFLMLSSAFSAAT